MDTISRDAARHGREGYAIAVLSLGFGWVGFDRFIIGPLFPVLARDLGLDYADIGLASASLAATWGLAALLMGRSVDRVGARRVLVPAIVAFSLLSGMTGLAVGLGSLVLVRALMGLAEGAFVPACIVAITAASRPSRVGLNVGIGHVASALFGLAIAPPLATYLVGVLPSWRWVFFLTAIPALLTAWTIHRALPAHHHPPHPAVPAQPAGAWRVALSERRVIANAAAMSGCLAGVTVIAALLPSYLTDRLQLGLGQMGAVMSGLGAGGVVGLLLVPVLGDRFGHRLVAMLAAACQVGALVAFILAPVQIGPLWALLFLAGVTGAGLTALTVGPLTSGGTVGASTGTATGIVVGCGEILGGALAPVAAGLLATRLGIGTVPLFALAVAALTLMALALGAVAPDRRRAGLGA